jgi:hypothetical protein
MYWHAKNLKKYSKEIFKSSILYLIIAIVLSLWYFFSGYDFNWTQISPLEAPSIFERTFYSALTFLTLGAFLYKIKFYKFLYNILGDWRSFKEAKALIWAGLLYLMFFKIVPKFFDILNSIISFGYNLFNLILYIIPPVGISIGLFIIGFYIYKKVKILPGPTE